MKDQETPTEGENLENVDGQGVGEGLFVPEIDLEISNENVEQTERESETEQEVEEAEEVTQEQVSNAVLSLQQNLSTLPSTNSYSDIAESAVALQHMTAIANVLIKGKLCPFKRPEDVIIAMITGKQYGLPFMSSINGIYVIKDRPTMSTHLIRGLIIKAKIIFKKINDYEPIYVFYQGKPKADNPTELELIPVAGGGYKELFRGTKDEEPSIPHIKGTKVVDYITTYLFKRKIKMPDDTWETLEVRSSFRYTDAHRAGLLAKDNWKNYPSRMLDAKAFNIGAKEIADDILGGMYSVNELAETFGINYTINEDMQEQIIN
jgi:hypothetical protein